MAMRIVMLVLVVLFAIGCVVYQIDTENRRHFIQERDSAADFLAIERQTMEKELLEIEEALQTVPIGKACGTFLFEMPLEEVYTEAYPLLQEAGYTAILALSPEKYPGAEGCITKAEFHRLYNAGWEVAVYWDESETPAERMERMAPILRELGTENPEICYTVLNDYRSFRDEEMEAAGFQVVIHHGETGQLITRQREEGITHLGAILWNNPYTKPNLDEMVSYGGALVMTFDLQTNYGMFSPEYFANMRKYLEKQRESLVMTDISGIREIMADWHTESYEHQRKRWLQEQIASYDAQIEELYKITQADMEK